VFEGDHDGCKRAADSTTILTRPGETKTDRIGEGYWHWSRGYDDWVIRHGGCCEVLWLIVIFHTAGNQRMATIGDTVVLGEIKI
jgi:hypothetical protein